MQYSASRGAKRPHGESVWRKVAKCQGSRLRLTAGVIVVAKSEKTDNPITFISWIKQATPTMIVTLSIATLALVFFTPHFEGKGGVNQTGETPASTPVTH